MQEITVNTQSSIKIKDCKTLYFDPFKIKEEIHDADFIFLTHSHYDHFSKEDILKVQKKNTCFIVPLEMKQQFLTSIEPQIENCIFVTPHMDFEVEDLKIHTLPAYNIDKPYHLKEKNWCGYLVTMNEVCYYIAGDTDFIEEMKEIDADIAFIPIGGVYTMDYKEALCFVKEVKPDILIPIHYGSIVGEKTDGKKLEELIKQENLPSKVILKL